VPTGESCELIAISQADVNWTAFRSTVRLDFPEAHYQLHSHCYRNCTGKRRCKGPIAYSFYNVLWIEWKDLGLDVSGNQNRIAYRKALGRVYKPYWDASDVEMIDVRLG
jgi:hypothetical protein